MAWKPLVTAAAFLALAGSATRAQTPPADPMIGTWKLNVAKSNTT